MLRTQQTRLSLKDGRTDEVAMDKHGVTPLSLDDVYGRDMTSGCSIKPSSSTSKDKSVYIPPHKRNQKMKRKALKSKPPFRSQSKVLDRKSVV